MLKTITNVITTQTGLNIALYILPNHISHSIQNPMNTEKVIFMLWTSTLSDSIFDFVF